MKILRIYDHLGELKKELNVFVEGADFKWQANYPECVWLGTITLEDAGKEPEKPGELVVEIVESDSETTIEELAEQQEVVVEKETHEVEAATEEEVEPQAPFTTQLITTEELSEKEEGDEPKRLHGKRGRKSGTHPSDYLKSIEVIRKDDTRGNIDKGD